MTLPKTYIKGFHNDDAIKNMTYKKLGETDMCVSKLSLGGTVFGGVYGEFDDKEARETIEESIKNGINYIDTAPYYGEGRSEAFLGKVLKDIPREAYYISTKVGRYTSKYETMFDYSKETIISRFEDSLERLCLKYVDFAIVHDVEFGDMHQLLNESIPAVQALVAKGKVRYTAISAYPVSTLWDVVQKSKIKIDIVLSYSRETLFDSTLSKYADKFKSKGVGIVNASPTGLRLLSNCGPEAWHPASKEIKNLCAQAAAYCKENGVELGTLAVYHALKNDNYDTCLVGFNTRAIMNFNLNLLVKGLSPEEQKVLDHLKDKFFKNKSMHWEGMELLMIKNYLNSFKTSP
ncbi:L-galactose dehydrogenase-like [Cimex lectularius]|uniref:NADP-dependent oxidoreductase domain-containing protein n=1 Tax=Cimex lectularius TaxID=79782 RepID=A0A8I6SAW6_CIMLE|nr:L-galactose dehydrogenase-like [Cimex lectularius]